MITISIPYWPQLGPGWAKLGPSWAPVGSSWAPVGPNWGPFGNAAWVGTRRRLCIIFHISPLNMSILPQVFINWIIEHNSTCLIRSIVLYSRLRINGDTDFQI